RNQVAEAALEARHLDHGVASIDSADRGRSSACRWRRRVTRYTITPNPKLSRPPRASTALTMSTAGGRVARTPASASSSHAPSPPAPPRTAPGPGAPLAHPDGRRRGKEGGGAVKQGMGARNEERRDDERKRLPADDDLGHGGARRRARSLAERNRDHAGNE